MTKDQSAYIVFGAVLVLALLFDLGLFSTRGKKTTIRQALYQTFFWVALAMGFFVFMWLHEGRILAIQYLSGYLMEWSLSIDNIFVFILIFSAFSIREKYFGRVLLIGILMAIIFRVLFITVGVALVDVFHWILYVFGAFLLYTGYRMFTADDQDEFDPKDNKVFRALRKIFPLVDHDGGGKYRITENGKKYYTTLFVVVLLLAVTDIVFALDSIPAVMGISRDRMVIYTSNIFAVLGLRSLFFLLRGAVNRFEYLQQGIAIVLVFIGAKMLAQSVIDKWIPAETTQVIISFAVILACIGGSMLISVLARRKRDEKNTEE